MENILFFDKDYGGHHSSYLNIIIRNTKNNVFLLENNLRAKIDILSTHKYYFFNNEFDNLYKSSFLKLTPLKYLRYYLISSKILSFVNNKALQLEVNSIVFMKSDFLLVNLIFTNKLAVPAKFIIIRQLYFYYNKVISLVIPFLISRHRNIQILTINPQYFAFLKKYTIKNIDYLPDPVIKSQSAKNDIIEKRKVARFLFYGAIDSRKGLIHLLNAILINPLLLRNRFELQVAGKIECKLEIEINEKIRLIQDLGIKISVINEFLSEQKIKELILNSDYLFCTYINHFGSSGVILSSAKYNKPVIASNVGLLKYYTQKYKLGLTVNPYQGEEILSAILNFLDAGYKMDESLTREFIEDHDANLFLKAVIK